MIETLPVEVPAEAPVAPAEPTTPMRPSEAMRLGAMSTEQAFGTGGGGVTMACAIVAMQIGYGVIDERGFWSDAASNAVHFGAGGIARVASSLRLPVDPAAPYRPWWVSRIEGYHEVHACPVHGCRDTDGQSLIIHLNDSHRWPRNKIADWLESIGL